MNMFDGNLKKLGKIPPQYDALFNEQYEFLMNATGNDEKICDTVKKRMGKTILISCGEMRNGKLLRPAMYNGKMQKVEFGNGGAQVGLAMQNSVKDGWNFATGIYIRERAYDINNRSSYTKTLPHEVFHAMSENTTAKFDENGHCYTKSGFKVTKYDKADEEIPGIPALGLTEGTTEMLANMFNGTIEPHAYSFPTYIARILNESKHKPSLLQAYLSENEKDVYSFLENFGHNQKHTSPEALVRFKTGDSEWRNDKSEELILGCIEYTINSFTTVEELEDFGAFMDTINSKIASLNNKQLKEKIEKEAKGMFELRRESILNPNKLNAESQQSNNSSEDFEMV